MATLTFVGTVGNIDCQRHLIRYFLKNDIIISVAEHNIFVQPPFAVVVRNYLRVSYNLLYESDNQHYYYGTSDTLSGIFYLYAGNRYKLYSEY